MAKTRSSLVLGLSPRVCNALALLLLGMFAQTGCNKSSTSADVLGKPIEFKAGGNSEAYRVTGWSTTETNFTWTEGTSAKLALPVPANAGALVLKMTMAGLVHEPGLPFQPVEVYANGQKIADWQVGSNSEFTTPVSAEMTKDGGTLSIEFRIPKAVSPKSLGISVDERVLGLCVRSLQLAKA
jgi:hypothetical protein